MNLNAKLWCDQFRWKYAAFLVMMLMIVGLSAGCISNSQLAEVPKVVAATEAPTLYDENIVTSLYERTAPAVVEVTTRTKRDIEAFGLDFPLQTGQGSGFIIDEDGHVLTNYHVVVGADEVRITLQDGRMLEAEVLGTDREDDVALLKVDADEVSGIVPLALGDSDAVKPGQMAIALGAPFGLQGSITVGVISGTGRSVTGIANRNITDTIQTDAAINFGNSGGPLLNSKGEVVGINTAIQASFSQATGIGYAVPINTVKSVLPDLIEGEEISRPWLGISGMAINSDLVERLELPLESGVYVISVTPDSPAEEAGVRGSGTDEFRQPAFGGDIITEVDGQAVSSVEDLLKYFNGKRPGDQIILSIYREGEPIAVDATLGEWPEETSALEGLPMPEDFDLDKFHWWRQDGDENP